MPALHLRQLHCRFVAWTLSRTWPTPAEPACDLKSLRRIADISTEFSNLYALKSPTMAPLHLKLLTIVQCD